MSMLKVIIRVFYITYILYQTKMRHKWYKNDGDLVIVREQNTCRDGDYAVVLVNESETLHILSSTANSI